MDWFECANTWMPFVAKYDATYWQEIVGRSRYRRLMGTLQRLVENQEQRVTLALTDSLAEHEVLEALLEDSKPTANAHPKIAKLDYLLRSPWRYPPLPWGSRFGRRFEPGLFYGALNKSSLFAEAAYYRFVFATGMKNPFADRVISQFTVYKANYQTAKGVDLSRVPFSENEKTLRHPSRYSPCQELGSVLRERGTEALVYLSARTSERAFNVALFSPNALRSRKHKDPRQGLCEINQNRVSFRVGDDLREYSFADFAIDGQIPLPA